MSALENNTSQNANAINSELTELSAPKRETLSPIDLSDFHCDLLKVEIDGINYGTILRSIAKEPIEIGENNLENKIIQALTRRIEPLRSEYLETYNAQNLWQKLGLVWNTAETPERIFLSKYSRLAEAVKDLMAHDLVCEDRSVFTTPSMASPGLSYTFLQRYISATILGLQVLDSVDR